VLENIVIVDLLSGVGGCKRESACIAQSDPS
jgi:hypothetical protein